MSTKTSFKRIALVAASALAIAGFSAVPSANAATTAASITGISLAADTRTATVGTSVGINFAFKANADAAVAGEEETFTAYLSAYPANGFAQTTATSADFNGSTAFVVAGLTNATIAASGSKLLVNATAAARIANETQTASSTSGYGSFNFTPSKAGVHTLTVFHDADDNGAISIGEFTQTISVTVAASSGLSTSASTAFMGAADAAADAMTSTTNALPRTGTKANGTQIAQVQVNLIKTDGTADSTSGHVVSASISGAGFVLVNATAGAATASARTSSFTGVGASKYYVHIGADGTSGTGTVTVSVTDVASSVTTTLGTFTITSYGSAAKLEVSTVNYTIGKAGSTTGAAKAARTAGGETLTATDSDATVPAFIVKATDSAGALVNLTTNSVASVPAIVSSDATVITGGTCVKDDGSAPTTFSSGAGTGFYNCSFTAAQGAKSGASATLTIRSVDPAGDGTTFLTTTQKVTIGGSVAKEVISTDKTSYSAGEGMIVTLTATDSSGNPAADGSGSPALSGNKAVGGSLPAAGQYVGGKSATTAGDVFAPAIGGDFIIKGTGTDAAATALSITVSIEGDASSSLALDAANAATDAANNAYDEAQNATQAASDALAAVTELAAEVKSLIASVKKLTAAVAKLKK